MDKPMMTCGHTANAYTLDANGKKIPVCVICDCVTIADNTPSLEGRLAECDDCGHKVPSDSNLPFFKYRPNQETDSYYDGCYGWD